MVIILPGQRPATPVPSSSTPAGSPTLSASSSASLSTFKTSTYFYSSAPHPSCRRRLNALEDTDVVLDFAEAVTSTSVKQSKSKEDFGTFCNPRLEDQDLVDTWNDSRSWNQSPASPFLINPTSQPVQELIQAGLSHQSNSQNSQLNHISPFKHSVASSSYRQSSSQSNHFQQVISEVHLQQQQHSNSRETFHPSLSQQDPLNSLGPLHQSSEDPYNEDIWAAYSKNAQEVLSYQGGFESGPEWSGAHLLPSLQAPSVQLLLSRLRLYEPPNIDNIQSWLDNFDSIFRLLQLIPNLFISNAQIIYLLASFFDIREFLANEDFQQDLLLQPFNSFDEFANFLIEDLNQYLTWFFNAPEGTNFLPERGNFLRQHIPVILGEYLPSEAVGKGTELIVGGKAEEMVLSPQQSPTPQTGPIFFPPFAIFEDQEKGNHSRGEDLDEEGAPAKRVMVEVAALDRRSQPLSPLLLPLNLSQPPLSLNLSQPATHQTLEETRMRRSSHAPQSGNSRSGARRQRHLTG